jgi:hypothetical protein
MSDHPKLDAFLDRVLARHWWVCLAIAAVAYGTWRLLPPMMAGHPHLAHIAHAVIRVAPPLSIMFAAIVPVALLSRLHRQRMKAAQREAHGEQ